MLSQQQIEAIILYHLYGESEAAAMRFREAVTNAAKEIAAQSARAADTAPVKARVRKVIRPKILIDSDDLPRG